MSFCLHHSKLFTRHTKFAQLPCLPLANKFPPKLSIWRVNGQTSNPAGQGVANGGFGVIISVE